MKLPAQIQSIITNNKNNSYTLSGYLVKGTLAGIVIQALAVLLVFFTNFIVARLAGANVYGITTYIFTCITAVANIAVLGLDTVIVKEAAVYKNTLTGNRLKGLVTLGMAAVVVVSIPLSFLLFVSLKSASIVTQAKVTGILPLALTALPLLALTTVLQSVLQGLQKVILAQLLEKIIKPAIFLLLMVAIYFFNKTAVTVTNLIWFNVIAAGVGLLWALVITANAAKQFYTAKANYVVREWTKSASYFLIIAILQIINSRADVFLLGAFKNGQQLGIYNIAVRLADFVGMPLFIINPVIAPAIARLYHSGEKQKLQKLITISARAAGLLALPAALLLIFAGRPVLGFFRPEFSQAYNAMLIVVVAQIINIASGSVGYILTMTGHEKYALTSLLLSCIVNVGLNLLLIPSYGINGTAIAVACGIVTWNAMMLFFVVKKTNIYPTIFGAFKRQA